MFIIIFILLGSDRPSRLIFFLALFTSFHTHVSLLTFFFCFFVFFHSCCSYVRVFGKILVHEFLISYRHIEGYFLFSDSATTSAQCEFRAKN